MVELADTLDLGSNGYPVQVRVLLPAPRKKPLLSIDKWGFFELSVPYGTLSDAIAW